MSYPEPWTPEELRKMPKVLDLFRSTYTGRLFELYHIDDAGTAYIFDIENMEPATIPYDKFRQMTTPEPEFIGEDR